MINLYSQSRLELFFSGGSSNLIEVDEDQDHSFSNFHTSISSFSMGARYNLFTKNTLYPATGLSLSLKGANDNIPAGLPGEGDSWPLRFLSLDVPLLINYSFEPWLQLKCGLNASVPVYNYYDNRDLDVMNVFFSSLLFVAGTEIRMKSFSIDFNYSISITPVMETTWADIWYNERILQVGIGYNFYPGKSRN
jgi:hypothetical protein